MNQESIKSINTCACNIYSRTNTLHRVIKDFYRKYNELSDQIEKAGLNNDGEKVFASLCDCNELVEDTTNILVALNNENGRLSEDISGLCAEPDDQASE